VFEGCRTDSPSTSSGLPSRAAKTRNSTSAVFGIHVGRADDHFRAERSERVHLFLRLLVGRRENALVALYHGRDRQAHPGVAGCPLDNRAAGLQQSGALRVFNHLHRHPILDGVAGIEGLDLGEHGRMDEAARNPFSRTIGVSPMASRMVSQIFFTN
jgi:hypothetical protein